MYDYIYLFFYKFFEWKKDGDARDSAIYGIMLTVFFHLFFLYTTFNYFTGMNPLAMAFGSGHSKFYWIPLVVLIMFSVYRIFERRSDQILTQKNVERKLLNIKHVLFVSFLVFGPFFIGAQLLNK